MELSTGETTARLTPETAEKLKQQNIVNLIKRVQSGKPITAQQQKQVDMMLNPESFAWPQYIDSAMLARCFGVSERWVHQLAEDGVIRRADKGKYTFPDVISLYIDHVKNEFGHGKGLKQRELELKCEKLEQDIHRRREEIADEERRRITGDIVDGMQEIRSAYMRLKLGKATTERLKKAFERAIDKIKNAGSGGDEE